MTALLLLAVPGLVAFALALALGGRRRGGPGVLLAGIVLAAGLLVFAFAAAPTERTCSDCSLVLGRYISPIFTWLLLLALASWVVGAALGAVVRRSRLG